MSILVKNPFNCDNPEKDPMAYGLVEEQIISCIQCLFDNKSILISGPRGIGKSSLGVQLQNLLEGDYTLLDRLAIRHPQNNNFICILSVCSKEYSLPDIVIDIINSLERKVQDDKTVTKFGIRNAELGINFGVFTAKVDMAKKDEKENLGSLATILVAALKHTSDYFGNIGINILIDEVDRINETIDFAHFIKIVKEKLNYIDYNNISFIFAGQLGVYTRFIKEQPAFERIVTHIVLNTLDRDNSVYIVDAVCQRSDIKLKIREDALELIVSLSSGFPYILQLLGYESFSNLAARLSDYLKLTVAINKEDVLQGIENILYTKQERYYQTIDSLNEFEKQLIFKISTKDSLGKIPIVYQRRYLANSVRLLSNSDDENEIISTNIINSLEAKRILREIIYSKTDKSYIFYDELFRIFVATGVIESRYKTYRLSVRVVQKQIQELRDNEYCDYYSTRIDKRFFNTVQAGR